MRPGPHFTRLVATASIVAAAAALARAASPGFLDPAFNLTGTALSSFSAYAGALLLDESDRIIVGGYTDDALGRAGDITRDFLVARYNFNGASLDLAFGGETTNLGTAVTDFRGSNADVARDIAFDSAGRIVAAGWMVEIGLGTGTPPRNENFAVARYTRQGVRDVTFNGSGAQIIGFDSAEGHFEEANAVAVDGQDRIVVAGTSFQPHGTLGISVYTDFAIARLNSNGQLDTTFGTGGKVLIDFGGPSFAHDVAVDDQGRIVVVGVVRTTGDTVSRIAVARLQSNGTFDTTFGDGGKKHHSFGRSFDLPTAMALDAAGGIVIGGIAADFDSGFMSFPAYWEPSRSASTIVFNQTADFALMRLLNDGSIDSQFGNGGATFTDFANRDDFANALGIDHEGRIVLAGATSTIQSHENIAIARYTGNGILDTTFGVSGRMTTDLSTASQDVAMDVAFDSANRIVVAGFSRPPDANTPHIALARYDNGTSATPRTAELIDTLTTIGAIDNEGVSSALSRTLTAAQAATDAGRLAAAENQLEAFVHIVEAQRGKHIAASATLDGVRFDPSALLIDQARAMGGH